MYEFITNIKYQKTNFGVAPKMKWIPLTPHKNISINHLEVCEAFDLILTRLRVKWMLHPHTRRRVEIALLRRVCIELNGGCGTIYKITVRMETLTVLKVTHRWTAPLRKIIRPILMQSLNLITIDLPKRQSVVMLCQVSIQISSSLAVIAVVLVRMLLGHLEC